MYISIEKILITYKINFIFQVNQRRLVSKPNGLITSFISNNFKNKIN